METARNPYQANLENKINHRYAPATVVQRIRDEILDALNSGSNIIFLSGEIGKGKTTLLEAIGKNIAANSRLIFFNGIDLLSGQSANHGDHSTHHPLDKKGVHDFSIIKDFIYESANMEEKLTIIIDAADCLPTDILSDLLNVNKQSTTSSNSINLIMAGLPNFIDQLNEIEDASIHNLIHFSMDELNEDDIDALASSKEYRNKLKNDEFIFDQDALETLSIYVEGDQQLLDVILEWCFSIVNADEVNIVTRDIATRAITYAEQFSKDKNIALANSYPPSKDIDNYLGGNKLINEVQVKNTNTNKHIRPTNIDAASSSIPTITFQVDDIPSVPANEIHTLEDEIMPTQWVPASSESLPSKKPLLLPTAIIFTLIIGLALLIYLAMQSNVVDSDGSAEEQIVDLEVEKSNSASNTSLENNNNISADNENLEVTENFSQGEILESNDLQAAETISPREQEGENASLTADDQVAVEAENLQSNTTQAAEIIDPLEQEGENVSLTADNQVAVEAENLEIKNTPAAEIISSREQEDEIASLTADAQPDNLEPLQTSITNRSSTPLDAPEIDKLLAVATQQFEAKNLTTPAGENAFETYQTILAKAPNHEAAQQGIQNIHAKYVSWANYYLRINQNERARFFYSKALEVSPKDKATIQMLQNLAGTKNSVNADVATAQPSVSNDIQTMLDDVSQKMQQINSSTTLNPHTFDLAQESLETYQTILARAPNHEAAQQGIQNIHDLYVSWANYYLLNNDNSRAQYFSQKAREINSDDLASHELLQNISQPQNLEAIQPHEKIDTSNSMQTNQEEKLFIGDLLLKAKQQIHNKNLTSPANNNAYETYQKVLQSQPDNPIAIEGISMIKRSYIDWAEQDLKKNNYHRAVLFYKKALAIDPADTQLVQRLEEIKSLRSTPN